MTPCTLTFGISYTSRADNDAAVGGLHFEWPLVGEIVLPQRITNDQMTEATSSACFGSNRMSEINSACIHDVVESSDDIHSS